MNVFLERHVLWLPLFCTFVYRIKKPRTNSKDHIVPLNRYLLRIFHYNCISGISWTKEVAQARYSPEIMDAGQAGWQFCKCSSFVSCDSPIWGCIIFTGSSSVCLSGFWPLPRSLPCTTTTTAHTQWRVQWHSKSNTAAHTPTYAAMLRLFTVALSSLLGIIVLFFINTNCSSSS